jgi:type II secretion system protein C
MARILFPLCCAAGFLTVASWVSWPLPVSSPAVVGATAAPMATEAVAQLNPSALQPGRIIGQGDPVAVPGAPLPDSTQGDPENMEQFLRRVATFHDDGSLRGVRVYPGWNEQVFDEAGLRAGDLVVAVNGEPLNDPARASDMLDLLGRVATARVTVERDAVRSEFILWFPSSVGSQPP